VEPVSDEGAEMDPALDYWPWISNDVDGPRPAGTMHRVWNTERHRETVAQRLAREFLER
jgi:hypothetical protein